MSWQLASFVILGLALAAGFGWYERSKPPARVLALVAALAALAVVGRLAFAAFPNVKPTTDIVVLSGFALGAAPGFAVGAVAAIASNVFLGQGPWTAWQMLAWGGLGAAGGIAGTLARRKVPNRLWLAAGCGLAGLAFGAILDLYQWTYAAERTAASYVAIAGTSVPYNLAHVLGNVAFALAFGPAFLHVVARYRRRFEGRWIPPSPGVAPQSAGLVALAVALALGAGTLATAPSAEAASSADRAARYLDRAQNADGGFGGAPRQSSSELHSAWAALGLAATGRNPRDVKRGRRSVIDYLRKRARSISDTGEIERTILVLRAAGISPRRFAGTNLVRRLVTRRGRDGSWSRQVNWTAFGILALRASGERSRSRRVRGSARWLERSQNRDGGFGFQRGTASDVDDTGAALQALAAAGRGRSRAARRAISYLRAAQNPDGGLGQARGRSSNGQSTAWAVQGLVAAGRNPGAALRRGRRSPLAYLRSLQGRDGSFRYSRTSGQTPVWVTAQAAAAVARKPFPLAPVRRRSRASVSPVPGEETGNTEPARPLTAEQKRELAEQRREEKGSETGRRSGRSGEDVSQPTTAKSAEERRAEVESEGGVGVPGGGESGQDPRPGERLDPEAARALEELTGGGAGDDGGLSGLAVGAIALAILAIGGIVRWRMGTRPA